MSHPSRRVFLASACGVVEALAAANGQGGALERERIPVGVAEGIASIDMW